MSEIEIEQVINNLKPRVGGTKKEIPIEYVVNASVPKMIGISAADKIRNAYILSYQSGLR